MEAAVVGSGVGPRSRSLLKRCGSSVGSQYEAPDVQGLQSAAAEKRPEKKLAEELTKTREL